MASDPHKPLRDDVRLLGELLGETLRRDEGDAALRTGRAGPRAGEAARSSRRGDDFEALADELRAMPVAAALPVARSFAHFLNLANIAEQHHRVRRRRERSGSLAAVRSWRRSRKRSRGWSGRASRRTRCSRPSAACAIELVITAHPTEIMRRTLQHKYNRIAAALAGRDRPDLTPTEREALLESMRREIAGAWHTEEVRRERPSPLDEVRSGMAVFEETIWNARSRAVPVARPDPAPDRTSRCRSMPLPFASARGSAATATATRRHPGGHEAGGLDVALDGADLYAREVEVLRFELSMARASPELRARAQGAHEPYRAVLRERAPAHRSHASGGRGRAERRGAAGAPTPCR